MYSKRLSYTFTFIIKQLDIYGRLSKTVRRLICAKGVVEGGSAGTLAELPKQLVCTQMQM